jgi:Fe-S-cluster containining protein
LADDLERQMERGSLFTHSVLTEQAARVNEGEALLNGLVGLLVQRGLVDADELMAAVDTVRAELDRSGRSAKVDVLVRADKDGPSGNVDCETRIPFCRAACCSFRFPLNIQEIESGPLKWDLGRPYLNRQNPDGYCHCLDDGGCTIYDDRPSVCRHYTCEHDDRIWLDFEAMVPNDKWLDEHFAQVERGPIQLFMDAYGNGDR